MTDDNAATWPAAIEKSVRVVVIGAFSMYVAFLFLREGSCQAKPCIPIDPPIPMTDEENLSMLLKRSNGLFGVGIANLIIVCVNCMILVFFVMTKVAKRTYFASSDLRSKHRIR